MLLISKKKLYIAFLIIIVFFLVFFLTADPIFLFASNILSPELFRTDNKVITKEVEENIKQIYNQDQKYAYLTFDDGPSKKVTPKVLDILKKLDVKVNFFLVGKWVDSYPDIVKREYEEGHFLANHGYSHNNNKLYKSRESFLTEIAKTDNAISEAIGIPNYRSHLFRFPNRFYE